MMTSPKLSLPLLIALVLGAHGARAQSLDLATGAASLSPTPVTRTSFPILGLERPSVAGAVGLEGSVNQGEVSILLRFEGAAWAWPGESEDGRRSQAQGVLAHLRRGEIALDPTRSESPVPYVWAEFIPLQFDLSPQSADAATGAQPERLHITARVLPAEVHRDTRMGREVRVRGMVFGLEIEHVDPIFSGSDVGAILGMVIDLLGVSHELSVVRPTSSSAADRLGWHGGLTLAALSARVGARIRTDERTTLIVLGQAGGDVTFSGIGAFPSFCWSWGGRTCPYSEGNTMLDGWLGTGVHVVHRPIPSMMLDMFAEMRLHARAESARDVGQNLDAQLMTGVEVRY